MCLICSVKRADPIWRCDTFYSSFLINCIQGWAKDSIFQQKQQLEDDPQLADKQVCLLELPQVLKLLAPDLHPPALHNYTCYCVKTRDPSLLW